MAAPIGTNWGSIVDGYGRIGLYITKTDYNTYSEVGVQVWFWSKYSVADDSNTLYYDANSTVANTSKGAVTIATTVASGDGWSTSNQVRLATYSHTYNRETYSSSKPFTAKLVDVDRVGGTMHATATITIPARASYAVTYNANGGTGAPSGQTKYYGVSLTLSSAKPTRAGYTFAGWATSATGSVAYASGATYSGNNSVTLYAVWTANKYTVSYDANGGTGAPASQQKTHGTALTLSSTIPTRTNYTFLGWGTAASATTVAYAAGASYTANAGVTLYAIWVLSYVKPRISSLRAFRVDINGNDDESGEYAKVTFNWACDLNITGRYIFIKDASGNTVATNEDTSLTGTSGTASVRWAEVVFSTDQSYSVTVQITDANGDNYAFTTLPGIIYPMDVKAGGKGISFGKPAELEDVAEFEFDAKFNSPVYGKALGMDRLPAIPENSDFNDYIDTGCFAVQSNAIAETCSNIPVPRAGRLEVWAATGEGVRLQQWSYLRQRFIPYNRSNAVWEREVTRGEDNVWHFYDWWKSSLTPNASEKVYSKAAITIALGAASAMTSKNTYTQIPLNQSVVSTGSRLTLDSNSIKIGKNIEYVKVSGQALMQCGSTAGNRHVRIQKVRNGTTTGVAWTFVSGTQGEDTHLTLPPVIVAVQENDILKMVYYTSDTTDQLSSGSAANGWQTYMTVEEL